MFLLDLYNLLCIFYLLYLSLADNHTRQLQDNQTATTITATIGYSCLNCSEVELPTTTNGYNDTACLNCSTVLLPPTYSACKRTCVHGGICELDKNGEDLCVCPSDFNGPICEYHLGSSKVATNLIMYASVFGMLGIFLMLVILLLLLYYFSRYYKKKNIVTDV